MLEISPFHLIVHALAVWRISCMFTGERGPFDIFLKIRARAGIVHDDEGKVAGTPETNLGRLFSCLWCFSMWMGIIWSVMVYFREREVFWIALPFALSAFALLLDSLLDK